MSDNDQRPPVPGGVNPEDLHDAEHQETLTRVPTVDDPGTGAQDGFGFTQDFAQDYTQDMPMGAVPPSPAGPGPEHESEHKGHKGDVARGLKTVGVAALGGVIGAAAITAGLTLGGFVNLQGNKTSETTNQQITINATDTDATVAQAVAKKALPSVASIYVVTSTEEGVGSGVVLDKDGHILTNYHVVEGATSISVTIDGKSYEGSVLGYDQSSDLAVVKVDLNGDSVTPIEVGDSDSLVVGDWVMAIGSPYGLDQSVSTGIVSSLYRSTMMKSTSGNTIYANLIQTDAAINPGNSGGALVNNEGKLVGINSIIESESGSSSGIGFAISGNYAVKVANTIIEGKQVLHAYIGVQVRTVNSQNAQRSSLSVSQGAYVDQVTSDSPAAAAGLQEGDVITKIDDEDILSADALILAIRSHEVGDKITVTFMRGSEEKTVEVTLGSDESLQQETESSNGIQRQGSAESGDSSDDSNGHDLGGLGSLMERGNGGN